MKISAFAARNRTDGLHRIAPESIDTECQQQNAAKELQIKDVFIHIVEYETHSVSRQQRIEYIAKRRAYTCHETIPASLVQRTLYAKHPTGPNGADTMTPIIKPFHNMSNMVSI